MNVVARSRTNQAPHDASVEPKKETCPSAEHTSNTGVLDNLGQGIQNDNYLKTLSALPEADADSLDIKQVQPASQDDEEMMSGTTDEGAMSTRDEQAVITQLGVVQEGNKPTGTKNKSCMKKQRGDDVQMKKKNGVLKREETTASSSEEKTLPVK